MPLVGRDSLRDDLTDAQERQKQECYGGEKLKTATRERVQVICVRCRWQSPRVSGTAVT